MHDIWVTVYKVVTRELGSLIATGRWARRYPVGELIYPEPGSSLFCYTSRAHAVRPAFVRELCQGYRDTRVIRCRAILDPVPPAGLPAHGRWAEFWQKRQGFWPLEPGTTFALCVEHVEEVDEPGLVEGTEEEAA